MPSDDRFVLPSVEIGRGQRIAEVLTDAMKRTLHLELACLFCPDVMSTSGQVHYQVMECWHSPQNRERPLAEWISLTQLSQSSFHDARDYKAVQQSLANCKAYANGSAPGPFAKPGWFGELQGWAEEAIGPTGLCLNGNFRQLNASPTFSLIRFETNGPAVWFKAVGEPNLREFRLTIALAQMLPQYVPQILATRPEWNGWLAFEVSGPQLQDVRSVEPWLAAARALARLQADSVDKQDPLQTLGARDLTATTLSRVLQPFLEVMAELMEEQEKIPPRVVSRSELQILGEQLRESLSLLGQLGIPDTLGILDANPANIIVSPTGCKFLDWAEAFVGNPFFTLAYLQEHFRRANRAAAESGDPMATAYIDCWRERCAPETLTRSLAIAPMLAVFAYAAGNDVWSDPSRRHLPGVAPYLRSLTRRMQVEADRLMNGRSRWLH